MKSTTHKGTWGEIYQPAAHANGNFICLCAGVDSYILTLCVYTRRHVSVHLYECFSACVVFLDNGVQSRLNISACAWIFSLQISGFIGSCPRLDEALEGCRVFLFLPTSQLVTAGFPQTIKNSHLPVALVITPPIRTKSEEEYQWLTRVRTTKVLEQHGLSFILAWTIPHHKPGSNSKGWNHSDAMDYNRYSIKIKWHTPQLWEVGKAKDPCWGENWMSN